MIEVYVGLPGAQKHISIKRIEGTGVPSSVNRYRAWFRESPGATVEYVHRYGDGWLLCVQRALTALAQPTEEEKP